MNKPLHMFPIALRGALIRPSIGFITGPITQGGSTYFDFAPSRKLHDPFRLRLAEFNPPTDADHAYFDRLTFSEMWQLMNSLPLLLTDS